MNIFKWIKSHKKLFLTLVGILVLAELVWAGWTILGLTKKGPAALIQKKVETVQPKPNKKTSITLSSDKENYFVGEKVTVTINISSDKYTDGFDLILNYDPALLSVTKQGTGPVLTGSIFEDYPVNKVDEKSGRIALSGITAKLQGIVPTGSLGSLTFQAKKAGAASVTVDYAAGSTTDSNVIETKDGRDILEVVNNLKLSIR